jgi:uncharacterized membrane protein YagU involved in acid resistance
MVKGAIAGAVGVWVMDRVGWDMYLSEDPKAFEQEKEAQIEGKYGAHVAAGRIAEATGMNITEQQQHRAGKAIHYGIGIMPAAVYGALRNRVDGLDSGGGLLYGLGLFAVMDEGVAPFVLGITNKPTAYPWQAHWRGLITHLVLGAVTDSVLDALDRVT